VTGEPDVALVEMTVDELGAWLPGALERFVAARVAAGESPARANSAASAQREMSVPGGTPAPGHYVLHLVVKGERVGALWIYPGYTSSSPERYVFLVELDSAHDDETNRRAAIRAAERWAVGDGATRLALSVFGSAASTHAYEQLGYVVAATSMFKTLR
jgi:hypothetical protein